MKAHCGYWCSIVAAALLLGAAPAHGQSAGNAAGAAAASQEESGSGENVVATRIVAEDGRVLSEGPAGLPIQVGKGLDRAQVAESIRALYRSGEYADARAVSSPIAGGVRIDFIVREQLFFNQVIIRGLVSPPTEASAAAAVQLPLGEPYRADAVKEGLERLREVLREEGLYTAEVSAETVVHPENHQMDVIVEVKPGPRARVKEIQLENGTEYRDAEILARSKIKAGKEIRSARVQRGASRVRNFLVKKGHLNARAVVRRGEYDRKTNSVSLKLEVTQGPRVRIAVTGAKLSSGELKKLVPVYQEGAVDTDLLEEGKRNIRERLERDGYFDASVEYATSKKESQLSGGRKRTEEVITYRVERGDRHKLLGIEITGNHYFDTELLRSRLQIYGKAFATRGRFSRRLLESDRDSMRNLYLANGFLEAAVDAQALDNYKGKDGDLLIRCVVVEGPQTRVASVRIDGVHAFTQDELLGVIGSTPGQPYSEFNVTTDRDNILALYFNEGFPQAQFSSTSERVPGHPGGGQQPSQPQAAPTAGAAQARDKEGNSPAYRGDSMRLLYHIEEGPQTRVRTIMLTGYDHTRPGVIRREISMKPEAPLREGEVVESQRRLYNLGVFNRVTIQPQNPNGTDTNKDIVVLVEE